MLTRPSVLAVSLLLLAACSSATAPETSADTTQTDDVAGPHGDADGGGPGADDASARDAVPDTAADGATDASPTIDIAAPPMLDEDFEGLFALDRVAPLTVTLTEDEWNALLHDFDENDRNEVYRRARLTWGAPPGDGGDAVATFEDVGFRLRGNSWTRRRPEADLHEDGVHHPDNPLRRAHFKIKLDERFDGDESVYGPPSTDLPERPENRGRGLVPGVETLNLKFNNDDPSLIREALSYDLFRRAGVHAPRATFVRLYIGVGDEPPRSLGVFTLFEAVDADWLRRRFDGEDFVWKCLYQQEGPADLSATDARPGPDAGRIGVERTDPATPADWPGFEAYRPAYDLKTGRARFDEAEVALNAFIDLLRGNPSAEQLEAALDVDALLRAMAVNAFVGMADDYWRLGNNYYFVRRPETTSDGRWLFVPYDYDRTFGIPTVGPDPATSSFLGWGDESNVDPVMMERVLAIPSFRERYRAHVASLVAEGGPAHEATLRARAEALRDLVAPHAGDVEAEDPYPFDPDLSEILEYVETRAAVAREEVARETGR